MTSSGKARPFLLALEGKRLSSASRGHGSAILLEFGQLAPRGETRTGVTIVGEVSVLIEWTWRIERPRSILGGSWSDERRFEGMLRKLVGATVTAVEITGVIPELTISLSNGLRVASFMLAEGQPSWAVIARSPRMGSLSVRRGCLVVESPGA